MFPFTPFCISYKGWWLYIFPCLLPLFKIVLKLLIEKHIFIPMLIKNNNRKKYIKIFLFSIERISFWYFNIYLQSLKKFTGREKNTEEHRLSGHTEYGKYAVRRISSAHLSSFFGNIMSVKVSPYGQSTFREVTRLWLREGKVRQGLEVTRKEKTDPYVGRSKSVTTLAR